MLSCTAFFTHLAGRRAQTPGCTAASAYLTGSAITSCCAKAQLYCSSRLSGWQHIWQHHARANFAVTWGKGVTTASPAHCIHRSADLSTSRRGYCWRCRRCNHCCRQCIGFMHCRPCRGALEKQQIAYWCESCVQSAAGTTCCRLLKLGKPAMQYAGHEHVVY